MAQKKITELQLIAAITDSLNVPGDNGIQSYRTTATQWWTYIQSKLTGATGDLPYGSSASAMGKLAISTDLQKVLRPVGGLPAWAFPLSVQSTQTTTYAVSATGDMFVMLNASGGAFTATLPTAASVAGKVYILKKIGTDLNKVTIATTSSQTIDGVVGTFLHTPNETVHLVSDGTNWRVLYRNAPFVLSTTWTDTEANATTNLTITRNRNRVHVEGYSSLTGAVAGSSFEVTIPAEYVPDSTVYNAFTPVRPAGIATFLDAGINSYEGFVRVYSTTKMQFVPQQTGSTYSTTGAVTPTIPFTWGNGDRIGFDASWIVQDWVA